jgi:prophage maintenance system killer protein
LGRKLASGRVDPRSRAVLTAAECHDFEKAGALFHSLIKSHPFMDGTKRTAFAAAIYFLEKYGHPRPAIFPEDEVIRFCLAVAEENARQLPSEPFQPITVPEIAAWFRQLLAPPDRT